MYTLKQVMRQMEKWAIEYGTSFQYSIFFNNNTYEFCEAWDFEEKFDFGILLLNKDFAYMMWNVGKRYEVIRVEGMFQVTEIEG